MIMDMLGPSLESLADKTGKMTLKSVLMLADQLICRLEYLHNKDYVWYAVIYNWEFSMSV
jgi:serine/threonine protein kinase